MRHLSRCVVISLVLLGCAAAFAAPPTVVRSAPADGAAGVPVDVGVLRVQFDQDMRTDSFTCWKSPQGAFPPPVKENSSVWQDARTFELRLETLKPNTSYYVQFNAEGRQGFRSVADEPLTVTTISFTTVAETATPRQDVYDPIAEQKPRQDVYDPSAGNEPAKPQTEKPKPAADGVMLKWNAQPHQSSRMSQIGRLKLELEISNGGQQMTQTVDQLFKLKYLEEVLEAEDGRPTKVRRRVESVEMMQRDPNSGEIVKSEPPLKGLDIILGIRGGAFTLLDVKQGDREMAEMLAGESYWFSLVPDRVVKTGESWKLSGSQLQAVLTSLDATVGEVEMKLTAIEQDPQMKLDVAKLDGTIRGTLQLPMNATATFDGTVKADFVPALGLPFLRHVTASLRVDTEVSNGYEKAHVRGTGTFEAVEERALMNGPIDSGTDTSRQGEQPVQPGPGAIRVPGTGNNAPRSNPGGGPAGNAPAAKTGDHAGWHLALYREQYQGAFHMLIPKDWKPEGGMIPSGVGWNVVDLVENNIKFRVSSPDGKSFFGFYPRFYFTDPAVIAQTSSGYLRYSAGQVHNGVWLYPYMSIRQYVEQIVFGQFATQEFMNPQIVQDTVAVPELMKLAPSVAADKQAGYVEFECQVNGVPSRGRMYAVLYNLGAGLWSTVGTWGLVAPKEQWENQSKLMEVCFRTFRLDPQWVAKASAAANYRGTEFNRINREIHAAYDQMQKERMQVNSDINTEMYKVLTDQIETRDPETGKVEWFPMYERAFTNGRGDYFLTDQQGFLPIEDNPEWHKVEIVNRLERRP